jgi:putative transposase
VRWLAQGAILAATSGPFLAALHTYANELRRRRPKSGDKWHLDEVFLKVAGKTQYLWRAVDQDGNVLDILVQPRRNQAAAEKFFRKLLKDYEYVPRVLITDKLASYGAAKKNVLRSIEHRGHKGLNNRTENTHRPTRQRERARQRFKSPGEAQRFLAAFEPISGHFRLRRHQLGAAAQRQERARRFQVWGEVTGTRAAA